MKRSGFGWQVLLVFLAAVIGYAVCFQLIQSRRVAKGPWVVTFTSEAGTPVLVVNQPALGVRDLQISFPDQGRATNVTQTITFSEARHTPFDVPFGKCVFLDTVSLPGTVAFEMFGHEVQLLPRVLTIDKVERPWRSGETISLSNAPHQPPPD